MSEIPYQSVESGKENTGASIEVARLRQQQGDFEAAEELYHRIMEHDPSNPDVYYQLGILALQREALCLAQNYFRLAAELDPEQTQPHIARDRIAAERG